jgi:hypothetical protein
MRNEIDFVCVSTFVRIDGCDTVLSLVDSCFEADGKSASAGEVVPAGETVANQTHCLADLTNLGQTFLSAATFLLSPSFSDGLGLRVAGSLSADSSLPSN